MLFERCCRRCGRARDCLWSGAKDPPGITTCGLQEGGQCLVALVAEALHADPYCGDIFVFRSKRADRLKLIAWDGSGVILVSKVLESGRFVWPPIIDGSICLSSSQMALLLAGMDWTRVVENAVKRPIKSG